MSEIRIINTTPLIKTSRLTISSVESRSGGGGYFGPGQPVPPAGPPDEAGRKLDYPIGYNLWMAPKEHDLGSISFAELRALADAHDITRLLIETRKDQLEALSWQIQPITEDEDVDPTREQTKRAKDVLAFFKRPDGVTPFGTWLRQLVEDLLVLDAPCNYVNRKNADTRFEVVSGDLIKLLVDEQGRRPQFPDPAYSQVIKGMPAWLYDSTEMFYSPRNPRPHRIYGYSPVQQIILNVNTSLRKQVAALQYYTDGNVPDAIIQVPKEWTANEVMNYEQAWNAIHSGNTAERRRAKFVPGEAKLIQTKEIVLKNDFDEWLTRVACFAFSISPSAFIKQMNRATSDTAKVAAAEEGLQPLMKWVKFYVDSLLQDYLGQTDMEFIWAEQQEVDPAVQAKVWDTNLKNGSMNINEVRDDMGLDSIDGGDTNNIYIGNAVMPVSQIEANAELQQQGVQQQQDQAQEKHDLNQQQGQQSLQHGEDDHALSQQQGQQGLEHGEDDHALQQQQGKEELRQSKTKPKPAAAKKPGSSGKGVGKADRPFVGTATDIDKYNPDEPRDDHGRWTTGFSSTTDVHSFIAARDQSSRPAFLSPHSAEELSNHRLYTAYGGKTGYALDPQGDLQNVFNNGGPKGAGSEALISAVQNGASTLDCYSGFLPSFYSKFGFVAVARLPFSDEYAPKGWNIARDGRPDIVFMSYRGGARDNIRERVGTFPGYKPGDGALVTDWGAGASLAQSQILDKRLVERGGSSTERFGGALRDHIHRQPLARSEGRVGLRADALGKDYSPDEPRDEHGRWTSGGSSSYDPGLKISPTGQRAFRGKSEAIASKPSKQDVGALGEKIAIAYLQSQPGLADAQPLNAEKTNYPVDMVGDHELYEVKTGLVSNSPSAQQWRATIGQPGKAETTWLKTASSSEKAAWNAQKAQAIMDRKSAAVRDFSQRLGVPVNGKTLTIIMNPDLKLVDVHVFDGFHARIAWNSPMAKAGYVGTFRYE